MRWTATFTLSLLLSTLASAGEPASLNTAGTVWTNKVLLPSGTTLHQGDRVETDRASAAVIASRSTGRVEVRESSSVSLGEGQVTLHRGVVSTAKAAVQLGDDQFGDVHVKPRAVDNALVVVAKRGKQILIAAHRGDALISQPGVTPLLLPAGSYAVPAGQAPTTESDQVESTKKAEPTAKEEDDDDDDKVASAASTGTDVVGIVRWVVRSLGSAGTAASVISIGAVAVGATTAGFALTEDSPSPSR